MGILSKTVSICQYRVVGDPPREGFFDWAAERLAENAFRSIEHSAEEFSIGWVAQDESREGRFSAEKVRRDHYLVFSLRRDQRRLPAALLRAHVERTEREFLAGHAGLRRVPKAKREELKEAVRGALLAKTLPSPAVYDVVWDTRRGLVTFASLNGKVAETFEERFKTTFDGLRLVALHPYARAEAAVAPELRPRLAEVNGAKGDGVLELIRDNLWLGRDFLRWLLFRTVNGGCALPVDQPGPAMAGASFNAFLDDRLILMGEAEEGKQRITVNGPQNHFDEVRAALRSGKEIVAATLHLEQGEEAWKLTLKGENFHFAVYRCPPVQLERDASVDPSLEAEAVFYQRMSQVEAGLQLFDGLLGEFLRQRLGEGWPATEAAIGETMK